LGAAGTLASMPPPLTAERLVTAWTVEPAMLVLSVVAVVTYLGGVRRLAHRGRDWPLARTVSFLAGVAVLVVATMSGLAAYDRVLFSVHVVQHLLLAMAGPILIALAAPVTLALQATTRPTQVFLLRILHSTVVRTITHPAFIWMLFGGTLFVLYFTPLYELSLRNDLVHAFLHLHFIVSGLLFFWIIVGLDPSGWRLPYWSRLLLVLVAVPFHVFLGVALLSSDQVLAADWYESLGRTWGASALADQRTGAGILWSVGDLLSLTAAAIIAFQWIAHDEREAARHDRKLDAEQDAAEAVEPT
jgi:putative copper resistance protein D